MTIQNTSPRLALLLFAAGLGLAGSAWAAKKAKTAPKPDRDLTRLEAMTARLTPVAISADTGKLSAGNRKALAKIIEASRYLNPLYFRQVWQENPSLRKKLEAD